MFRRRTKAEDVSDCVDAMRHEIEQCRSLRMIMQQEINNAKDINEALRAQNDEYLKRYHEELITHKKDIECIEQAMELNKYYCYLVPKLLNSCGIELPDEFDITNLDDVKALHKRFRSGDLINVGTEQD